MMKTRFLPSITLITLLAPSAVSCAATPPPDAGSFAPSGTTAPQAAPIPLPTTPTITKAEADKIVLDRYRLYQETYEKAYATGDPSPLADIAVDPLLTIITNDVNATYTKGHIWRFTNLLNPRIQKRSKDLSEIIVIDCVRTLAAYRYSKKTGKRTGGTEKSSTYSYAALFQYDGTTWSVAEARKGKPC
ncbi:hypothetical protein EDD29_0367 [Actinocorallia herbida]|uniref:Mce-associated membrane protein n=1 Tax=Actinocorallia herbida TaxID=58109 RepID=A0A3N1CNL3_9ACTN|nr:hypothetical protein [Actinocorallia herbida]ROO82882.1 hypothetical protein EDD29_0367 [Actinocorallia herbida]